MLSFARRLLAILCWIQVATSLHIRVCQNKDCCKRFSSRFTLVETLQDLILPSNDITVESTGCLSNCGMGPNICVDDDECIAGVETPVLARVQLEPTVEISPTRLAAVRVMEQAVSSDQNKLKYLNSVIQTLQRQELGDTHAFAHAHALRAEAFLDQADYPSAQEDAKVATQLGYTGAWRSLADAEEGLGNVSAAIEALSMWAREDPTYQSKVQKEIKRLKSL